MADPKQIDITGVDLRQFVRECYRRSRPQGLGFLHYREGDLDDISVEEIVSQPEHFNTVLRMDYVHGRAVKMNVYRDGDRLWIHDDWYDHTSAQLDDLLAAVGVER